MLKSTRVPSNAVRPVKQLSSGCASLLGLPFLIGGLAIGWFLYFPAVSTWWSARLWEEVPCWVESADLGESSGSRGGSTYQAKARYRYQYLGHTYHSEQVGLIGGSDNMGTFQQEAHAQLCAYVGQERPFRCYVNPAKPEQAVLFRELRWGLMLLMSLFPTLFPLAGSAVIFYGLQSVRSAICGRKLQALHPEAPWRWRQEWAQEAVQPSTSILPFLVWVSVWIGVVQLPLAAAIVVSGEWGRAPLSLLGLLPLGGGVLVAALAWRHVSMRLTVGRPTLKLRQLPVAPGGVLEGELCFSKPLPPMLNVELRVLCARQITHRSGGRTSTRQEILWEHRETFSAAEMRRELVGVCLPLRVEIPAGLPSTLVEDAAFTLGDDEQHRWSLEVKPQGSGVASVLPLPVFGSHANAEPALVDQQYEVEAFALNDEALVDRLTDRGIVAELDADGLPTLFDCAPKRLRSTSVFLILFGLVWSGVFAVMWVNRAPFIFQLVWGVSSPLILGYGLWTAVHHRRVQIASDEMRVTDTAGPFYSKRQVFEPRHFVGFSHDSDSQVGNQLFYRVRGETTYGKQVTLVDGITESVTAQTLANKLDNWRRKSSGQA